jgi:two-component system chemotaxis response regulator CheB
LIEVVSRLDRSINVPIFITQHMPEMFTKVMADRLAARGALPVFEAQDGTPVKPGHIYVAPGNYHLEVSSGEHGAVLVTSQGPKENSCRPSADVMFRSLARHYGPGLVSIVMTGMGQDGKKGCEVVKERGGIVVAQDESSSLVWGMPRAVISASLHDAVVPLSGIAPLINASCSQSKEKK